MWVGVSVGPLKQACTTLVCVIHSVVSVGPPNWPLVSLPPFTFRAGPMCLPKRLHGLTLSASVEVTMCATQSHPWPHNIMHTSHIKYAAVLNWLYTYIPYAYNICRTDIYMSWKLCGWRSSQFYIFTLKILWTLHVCYHGSNQHSSRRTGAFTEWSVASEEYCWRCHELYINTSIIYLCIYLYIRICT